MDFIETAGVAMVGVAFLNGMLERERREKKDLEMAMGSGYTDEDEFEEWVASTLRAAGWRAVYRTPKTNDQGADVIATDHSGTKWAVQAKHYSDAVGNSAIQEAVASMAYYRATRSAVVTSGPGYTRAAKGLAGPNHTELWLAEDLREMARSADWSPSWKRWLRRALAVVSPRAAQ